MENIEEKEGAKPAEAAEVKDVKPESSPEKDAKPESSTEQPWHKDPRFSKDLGLLKAAKSLMERNGLESVDELVELAESGQKIKGREVDLDKIDELKSKAKKLDEYIAFQKDIEEKKKREGEYPEQTIARLEEQLKKKEAADKHKEALRQEQEAAQQALKSYDREVQSLIKEASIPKEQSNFILKFFGVGNPVNEIDITDKKAIRRIISDGIKEKEAYDQAVIQAYIKGKEAVPKVGAAAPAAPSGTPPKIYLKDARKSLLEAFKGR